MVWPWLFSMGFHAALAMFLLVGTVGPPGGAKPSLYLVTLLPPAGSGATQGHMAAAASASATVGQAAPARPSATAARPNRATAASARGSSKPTGALAAQKPGERAELAANSGRTAAGPAAAIGSGPLSAAQVDQIPRLLHKVEPAYPMAARRRGVEGWVEIKFLVNRAGAVIQESVIKAEPEGVFENSALTALRAWRFTPGLLEGREVDTWMVQVIRFRLAGAG